MGATRHLFRSILLISSLLLISTCARADGFSATAAVSTCEIPGGGGGPGVNCPGVGGTLPSSMTAQASGTLISSNGKTSMTGNATVNGPSLSVSSQIQSSGNGVNAGINSYSVTANAGWNDTLTLVAGGTPATAQLGISLSPSVAPSVSLSSFFPTLSQGIASIFYSMSLFVSDPGLVPPGLNPGGGAISCSDSLSFGPGGAVQSNNSSCLPLDSFVLNGIPYNLQMTMSALLFSEPFDQNLTASDPFTLSVTPLESGVQVLSASGVSYFSSPTPPSVPEPSSLFLIASGLLCLGPWGRKLLSRK
jgi:hypothetical protein